MIQDIGAIMRGLDIQTVWSALGLPGEPRRSCRCPKHDDRNASFSVFRGTRDGRWLWKCHAGCGQGDLVDLWVLVTGCERGQALREIRLRFGLGRAGNMPAMAPKRLSEASQPQVRPLPGLVLDGGSEAEMVALARLRSIPLPAVRLAQSRGLLRFALYRGERCWVITDPEGLAVSCRPLNGKGWPGGEKAMMVRNSQSAHLLGAAGVAQSQIVLLCEGGPDLVAAHALVLEYDSLGFAGTGDLSCVAMLGASMTPPAEDCRQMVGKHVVILGHSDRAGGMASAGWARAVRPFALKVSTIEAGKIVPGTKDLNDVISAQGGLEACVASLKEVCHG